MSILGRRKRQMSRSAPRSWNSGGAQAGNLIRFLLALDGKLIWQVFGERLPHSHLPHLYWSGPWQGRADLCQAGPRSGTASQQES